jgi:hypothetical protein
MEFENDCLSQYCPLSRKTNARLWSILATFPRTLAGNRKGLSRHDHLPDAVTVSDQRIRNCVLYQVVDASDLLRIRIFTIVIIKALYHHCTFDDRTKTDMTWDGPYHNGVSGYAYHYPSTYAIMIRVEDTDTVIGSGK